MDFDDFSKDEKTIDAVVRKFEIIGEAANNIPEEIKARHPDLENDDRNAQCISS